jgi:hypothetical protein
MYVTPPVSVSCHALCTKEEGKFMEVKIQIFWIVMPRRQVNLEGSLCLHLRGQAVQEL